MDNQKNRELFLLELLHRVADKFKDRAILKGGMGLRLLNSPRFTQDLDYVFKTKDSRKKIFQEIEDLVQKMEGVIIKSSQLNSRGLIVELESKQAKALLEISVIETTHLPPEQITTSALSNQYQIPGRIITIMALAESYANKIVAALERDALRDLYDITIYQSLTAFDSGTLKKRLSRLQIKKAKPISMNFKEAATLLREKGQLVNRQRIERELAGIVPEDFMLGGDLIIKNSIFRLCDALENVDFVSLNNKL